MGDKRILLVESDTGLIQEFRQALGDQWQITAVSTGDAAMSELKTHEYEAVVAGLDLGDMTGAELVNYTRRKHPKTVRFVLASEDDKGRVMKEVLGAHQFLSKPLETSTLKATIEKALALDVWISSESMRALVARVRTFPAVPAVYLELLTALRSADTTTEEVGSIISKDMAITTKLLQVINSAYFGLPNKITDPAEAVGILGFEAVKSMVTAIKLLAHYDKIKLANCSIDQLWAHSTDVARSAKQIVLMHTGDRALAEMAFTAGLLHDVGKVVLAANFDQQYRGAQSLARKQGVPLWDIETEIFGATHGEVGAYLLGLWGMRVELLEATALHHYPGCSASREFTALTAVHVANVLEYEVNPSKVDNDAPKLDKQYLEDVGVLDYLDSWRQAVTTRDFSVAETRSAPQKPTPLPEAPSTPASAAATTANITSASEPQSEPESDPGVVEEFEPEPFSRPQRWLYVAAAGCALGLLFAGAAYLRSANDSQSAATASTKPASKATPVVVRARPLPKPEPVKAPAVKTGAPVNNSSTTSATRPAEPAKEPVKEFAKPVEQTRAPEPPPVAVEPTPAVAPQPVVPAEPAFPELKLQGLFLSADRPSAIVNGRMVRVNDKVLGARIIEIGRSNIVVEFNNQRKTLKLK